MPNVSAASKQVELSLVAWPRTYGISKTQTNLSKNLGTQRTGNAVNLGHFLLVPGKPTRKLSALSPQRGLLKPRPHNFLYQWFQIILDAELLNAMLGYQIPFHSVPVHLCVPVTCSDSTAPRVDTELNKLLLTGEQKRSHSQKRISTAESFWFQKRGNVSPCYRPESSQQVGAKFHFQM